MADSEEKGEVAVIGAGWYGLVIALSLKRLGYKVMVFEKHPDILSQISGNFGVRLHTGLHYPRSEKTRESCQDGFVEFKFEYPELLVELIDAIYALGAVDADGNPPKVTAEEFKSVCEKTPNCDEINPEERRYQNLLSAFKVDEPCIVVGERLRSKFRTYLKKAEIEVIYNYEVKPIEKDPDQLFIVSNGISKPYIFDKIINATSYQSLLPQNLPIDIEVVYQPCMALVHQDLKPKSKPISFIVMDGWFPCLMPYIEDYKQPPDKYILTHGKWTILDSCKTPADAIKVLDKGLKDSAFIDKVVKESRQEMSRFWPDFSTRFEYTETKCEVLAKIKTTKEFRSAVIFEDDQGVIHIIPGKVSNVFDAVFEILCLLKNEHIVCLRNCRFVTGGILDSSTDEILEKPTQDQHNTCGLNTYGRFCSSQNPDGSHQNPVGSHQNPVGSHQNPVGSHQNPVGSHRFFPEAAPPSSPNVPIGLKYYVPY